MEKITIYRYIASSKPLDAHLLINKYGKYRRARNEKELESQLKHFVRNNGSNGLRELSRIHPDRELIEEDIKELTKPIQENNQYANADGQGITTPTLNISSSEKEDINYSKMLIWGSFVLIGIAIIMKKQ
jgi:hypothetical protein